MESKLKSISRVKSANTHFNELVMSTFVWSFL